MWSNRMTIDRYSQDALRVLFSAQYEAERLDMHNVDCECILLGFFVNRSDQATTILKSHNLNQRVLRKTIEQITESTPRSMVNRWKEILRSYTQPASIGWSDDANSVMTFTAALADQSSTELIEPCHLLVSLLQSTKVDSVTNRALLNLDVDRNAMLSEAIAVLNSKT
jgi:ATP-dependent Clp protease ATP-binding subunit ClpA